MEEDINYSTVAFKDGGQPPREEKEDPTIYADVKQKETAATVSSGEAAAARSRSGVLAACLVVLCFLVAASVSAVVYLSVTMMEQRANLSNLAAENQQLISDWSVLERETEKLSRVAENLNWTLGVILEFDTFPVNEYCPEKKCQPCKKDWIVFQEKCYLFYSENPPWKSWEDSRLYCQNADSDLVVVDSLREQEFIGNHTEPYYDANHGYWLGLREDDDKSWVWVDGRNDTLSYWMKEEHEMTGSFALTIPGRNPAASWGRADNDFQNKFICERDVLIRSN